MQFLRSYHIFFANVKALHLANLTTKETYYSSYCSNCSYSSYSSNLNYCINLSYCSMNTVSLKLYLAVAGENCTAARLYYYVIALGLGRNAILHTLFVTLFALCQAANRACCSIHDRTFVVFRHPLSCHSLTPW